MPAYTTGSQSLNCLECGIGFPTKQAKNQHNNEEHNSFVNWLSKQDIIDDEEEEATEIISDAKEVNDPLSVETDSLIANTTKEETNSSVANTKKEMDTKKEVDVDVESFEEPSAETTLKPDTTAETNQLNDQLIERVVSPERKKRLSSHEL